MKKKKRDQIIDILLLALMVLAPVAGIVLKIMTTPASEGIEITGARVFFTIPMPVMDLPITESQVNSVIVLISVLSLCVYMTRGLSVIPCFKRQIAAEWCVEKLDGLIKGNMGEKYIDSFSPFVGAIMVISAFSSLMSLIGLRPPTSDINIVAGWAIIVFVLITYYKLKGGIGSYVKGFFEPFPVFMPFNVIGEFATPVSMSFRHYGNVISGVVISALVGAALQGVSKTLLGWLPGILGNIPWLQIGIPAVLSVYFDVFSGLMQAFIFAMLTMLYIATGAPED